MTKILHKMLALAAVALGVAGCNNDYCTGNSNAIPLAAFYTSGGSTATLSNITVWGLGVPGDSCIVEEGSASQLYLPLRLTESLTQYVIDYNDDELLNDTISLRYDAIPYFESRECGAMYNFRIADVQHTTNSIDSIALTTNLITNADVVTIKIFMQ